MKNFIKTYTLYGLGNRIFKFKSIYNHSSLEVNDQIHFYHLKLSYQVKSLTINLNTEKENLKINHVTPSNSKYAWIHELQRSGEY